MVPVCMLCHFTRYSHNRNPNDAEACKSRGNAKNRLGDLRGAEDDFRKYRELGSK